MYRAAAICTLDRMAESGTVAVLLGGRSSEREISLVSGAAVVAALRKRSSPPEVRGSGSRGPARCVSVEIEPGGAWRVEQERCTPAVAVGSLPEDTVYFIGLHGGEGENGCVQGFLETCSRRYTGSGVAASALCMDKHATRLLVRDAGLPVAPAQLIDRASWRERGAEIVAEAGRLSDEGWAVKPNCGGSSVATSMVERADGLAAAIECALATGDRALLERRVRGTEVTCGVLGNCGGELRALTPVEIVPKAGRFFDWRQKYEAGGAEEHCPPRTLGEEDCERVREFAVRAHRATGCDGYSRTDFILPEPGARPVFLEVNTLPGLTPRSLLPKAALAEGLSFRDLCLEILDLAVRRFAATGVEVGA